MQRDLRHAMEIGLDHLGLYHLVLFAGLGTEWSRRPDMLAGLPSNERACEHWLALRDKLQTSGFYQATLTNFEREEFRGSEYRFQYEESSFQLDCYEMLGFGPSGISCAARPGFMTALKTLNPVTADSYIDAVRSRATPWDRYFRYQPRDLRIFYLTRRLAALEIGRAEYRNLFGIDPISDFGDEFTALNAERLIDLTGKAVRPTPRGMFYADSIAALLASRQLGRLRSSASRSDAADSTEDPNDNTRAHM